MQPYSSFDIDAPAPWFLISGQALAYRYTRCNSLRDAITKAYEFAKAGSTQMQLALGETHQLGVRQIFALWQEHGFALPPNA